MRRLCLAARWGAVVAIVVAVRAQAPAAPAPLPAAARAAVQTFQQEHGVPGLTVAIGLGDAIAFAEGLGLADLENDVAATAATVYRLGSISKPVTAVAALRLCSKQQLALDGDVRTHVPEFPAMAWPITLRQLLCHQGGIRHYRLGESESVEHFATQRASLARFAADALLHEPGTKYFYSTYGYNLAAAAVEAGSGQPFAAAVAELAALAEASTLQDDDVRRLVMHRAQGYVRRSGQLQNSALMDSSYKLGGGGLCSSAPDLARFGLALLDGRLLDAAMLEQMIVDQKTRDGKPTGYGLGLRIGARNGRREWNHSGAQSRVSTTMVLWPEPRACAVVLCNLEGVRPLALAQQLLDLLAPGR